MRDDAFQHFRLHAFAALARMVARCAPALGAADELVARFPFLQPYLEELAASGGALAEQIAALEARAAGHLPLRALRERARLDADALELLLAAGLIEDDARFGAFFAALQGTPRPTLGLFNAWWRRDEDRGEARASIGRLLEIGALEAPERSGPRGEWPLLVPHAVWDALRGESPSRPLPGVLHLGAGALAHDEPLILPPAQLRALPNLAQLLAGGEVQAVIVRGPPQSGRRTVARLLARELGRGVLLADASAPALGLLATLLHAVPVIAAEPAPGETVLIPELPACDAPAVIVTGRRGGVAGPALVRAVTLTLQAPGPEERKRHWERALEGASLRDLDGVVQRHRLAGGTIRRAALLGRAHAALEGRTGLQPEDVREAVRSLHRASLETLAARLPAAGGWPVLALGAEVLRELRLLETRCRERERLSSEAAGCGVRALFQGPSGTGKTLAARVLGGELSMDVYRVDLSTVVSKYLGETEKNLHRLFELAEELDVMLLFDEGDSLLARRTGIGSSNDRYANLETNYLLQRIESYEGVVVITTNAADAIDPAFARRLEAVIDFRAPEPAERLSIWHVHLPGDHRVDAGLLREAAVRCELNGGQIRNAALHASLLALQEGSVLSGAHLEAAIAREYRRSGEPCPLRQARR